MTEELRLYTFTLYQLSSIQQGIQAAHAAVELGMKGYKKQMTLRSGTDFSKYHDWATNWKTMVLLNGGDLNELRELYDFFCEPSNLFPWAAFHEDESLGGVLTSIGIILPERIFGPVAELRNKGDNEYPSGHYLDWEWELIKKIATSSKAR